MRLAGPTPRRARRCRRQAGASDLQQVPDLLVLAPISLPPFGRMRTADDSLPQRRVYTDMPAIAPFAYGDWRCHADRFQEFVKRLPIAALCSIRRTAEISGSYNAR